MLPVGWTTVQRTYGACSKSCNKTYVRYFSLDGKHKHITARKLEEIEQARGMKPIPLYIKPVWNDNTSQITTVKVALPTDMGIDVSTNEPGRFAVVDVPPNSNAEKAGIQVGDLLRGVKEPDPTKKHVYYTVTGGDIMPDYERAYFNPDGQCFQEVWQTLNSKGKSGEIVLVIERRKENNVKRRKTAESVPVGPVV